MSIRRLIASVAAGALVAAVSFTAIAQDVDPAIASMTPEQKVEAREAAMKQNGGLMKNAGGLTGADAVANADKIIQNFTNFPALFSEDTSAVKSKAKPEIWANFDAFTALFAKAAEGAKAMRAAAEAGDATAYGAAMKTIGGVCGECHQQYRSE